MNHVDKIPASNLFDQINEQLANNQAEVKDAIKKGNGIFAFTIKGNSGEEDSWHVDLKETGRVGKGLGNKPNGMLLSFSAFNPSVSRLMYDPPSYPHSGRGRLYQTVPW